MGTGFTERRQRIAAGLAGVLLLIAGLAGGLVLDREVSAGMSHGKTESRTFYVSPDGDDEASGLSRGHAWQSLARVSRETLRPGDRVLLAGFGHFTGTLRLGPEDAGDPDNPVIIDSYGAYRATIVSDLGIAVHNTAGVTIRNLSIYGSGSGNEDTGVGVTSDKPGKARLDGITLENLEVTGFANGISISAAAGCPGFSNVTVSDSVVHGNRRNGLVMYGPRYDVSNPSFAHSKVTIIGVDAYDNTGLPDPDGPNTGNGIVIGSVDTGRIEQSTAFRNGATAGSVIEGPEGIWAYDSTRIAIEHNLSFSNRTLGADGGGFGLDRNTTDSVIQYNLSYDNFGAGVLIFGQRDDTENKRNVVRFNVSVNDARMVSHLAGIAVLGGTGEAGLGGVVSDPQVYQNTVVIDDNTPTVPAFLLVGSVDGGVVANNVLAGPIAFANRSASSDLTVRGNSLFSIGSHLVEWAGKSFDRLDDFTEFMVKSGAASGEDARAGIQTAPTMVNPHMPITIVRAAQLEDAVGFAPLRDSPLLDSGVALANLGIPNPGEHDFLGNAVTASGAAIGAVVTGR